MRDSFIFYKSFYEGVKELDSVIQCEIYNAIMEYEFNQNEVELSGVAKAIFALIKPQLEANDKRYENGKKGGAPIGNSNAKKQPKTTKKQPKNNQKQPNVNENENVNVNENDKLNEFNLYSNFDKNEQCECIAKSTNERCTRKSSFNINGKNYCNQHARDLIPNITTKHFKKPTLEEVKEYCLLRNNGVDPKKFIDFYEANNWTDSKGNKVKSWKQKVITWESHQPKQQLPDWFNKERNVNKPTEQEKQEMEEALRI